MMLTYNPAYDLYHCAYRILKILNFLPNEEYRIETIRIIDFFVLFPEQIADITLPARYRKLKNILATQKNSYNDIPNKKRIFRELEKFQILAIESLAGMGFLDPHTIKSGFVKKSNKQLPDDIYEMIERDESKNITREYINILASFDLLGPNGLKARTKLMEYKYDAI